MLVFHFFVTSMMIHCVIVARWSESKLRQFRSAIASGPANASTAIVRVIAAPYRCLSRRYGRLRTRDRLFLAVKLLFVAWAIWWLQIATTPTKAAVTIGALAAAMNLQGEKKPWQQAGWSLLVAAFVVIAFRSINIDTAKHEREQAQARESLEKVKDQIGVAVAKSQLTLNQTGALLAENQDILAGEKSTLNQTMGGSGYPILMPTFPSTGALAAPLFPVKIIYDASLSDLPLLDVNLDISLMPPPRTKKGVTPEIAETIFHPEHVDLGTILPGVFEAPFRLEAGRRYYIRITTRRALYYEEINIVRAPQRPGGWGISACIHQYRTNGRTSYDTLVWGKCE